MMATLIPASEAVVWVNTDERLLMVWRRWRVPEDRGFTGHWCDPIGAAYEQWQKMSDEQRVVLMLETAIDLAMQGIPMAEVLKAFSCVIEFRELGSKSYPMCRAFTAALVGRALDPITMPFEDLLVHYAPAEGGSASAEIQ
jgi:hypothetical protein